MKLVEKPRIWKKCMIRLFRCSTFLFTNSKEVLVPQIASLHGSSTSRQLLFKEQDDYSTRNFIPSPPCQNLASKVSFGAMAVRSLKVS